MSADRGDDDSGIGCQHGGRHARALPQAPVYTLVPQGRHAVGTGRRLHGATLKKKKSLATGGFDPAPQGQSRVLPVRYDDPRKCSVRKTASFPPGNYLVATRAVGI